MTTVATAAVAAPAAAPAVVVPDGIVPLADGIADDGEGLQEAEDEEVPLAVMEDEEDTTGLEEVGDEDVPLAAPAQVQEGSKFAKYATWSIIPILAAVAGKTAYDKKYRKGIFAGKRSSDDEDGNR